MAARSKEQLAARKRALSRRKRALKIQDFSTEAGTMTARVAEFCNWAAENFPGQVVTYEEITQAVLGLKSLPKNNSPQVKSLRGSIPSARRYSKKHFERDIVTYRGVGVRATTSEVDKVQSSLIPAAQRAKRSMDHLRGLHSMISMPELKEEIAEYPADLREDLTTLLEWTGGTLAKALKYHENQNPKALLPPPPVVEEA